MTAAPLSGTFAALYTPFTTDGVVDLDAYRALADRLAAAGVGLVPCGTTGETPTLTADEYTACVRAAVDVAGGRVPVIAGTGSNSTAHAVETTRHAKALGVDAALVVTPYYNKPPQRSLLAHFRAVADQGGLPIVLYNVPGRTGTNLLPETTLALATHPGIVAVKEASGSMAQVEALLTRRPAGFAVLSGDDALAMPLVLAGGDGVISVAANALPGDVKALMDAALAGDLARARDLQAKLLPFMDAIFCTTNPIPIKRVASWLGHGRPDCRLPLTADALDDAMATRLRDALHHAGVSL